MASRRLANLLHHGAAVGATDNFNLSFGHKLHHANALGSSSILNGTTTQLATSGADNVRDSWKSLLESLAVRNVKMLHPSAEVFVANATPTSATPTIRTCNNMMLGLCHKWRTRLISTDPTERISLARLLSSPVECFVDNTSHIRYVEMSRRACERRGIEQTVKLFYDEYKPGSPGRCEFVAIVGDAPVFKAPFNMWLTSV